LSKLTVISIQPEIVVFFPGDGADGRKTGSRLTPSGRLLSRFTIRFGIDLLAADRKRERLAAACECCTSAALKERVPDRDRKSAEQAVALAARQRLLDAPREFRDTLPIRPIAIIVAPENSERERLFRSFII